MADSTRLLTSWLRAALTSRSRLFWLMVPFVVSASVALLASTNSVYSFQSYPSVMREEKSCSNAAKVSPPMGAHKKYSSLTRVEADLARARAAIQQSLWKNQAYDIDYIPAGPVYRNSVKFQSCMGRSRCSQAYMGLVDKQIIIWVNTFTELCTAGSAYQGLESQKAYLDGITCFGSFGALPQCLSSVTGSQQETYDAHRLVNLRDTPKKSVKRARRSYLEMEKRFKVFVYEEGERPIFHDGPCKNIYSTEGIFINQIETSQFRTSDPEEAHVYFLPISVTRMVQFVYKKDSGDHWGPMKRAFSDYVNVIAGKYTYWNHSLGFDHFMLSCHDWGPELSTSVPQLYNNSIRALCNANRSEGFKPSRDVSIPEILLPSGTTKGLLGGPSASKRPILVFFAGGVHGPIRPILLHYWQNKDKDVQIHQYLPKNVSYYGMLRQSRYCICASGYEVASPRMVEALYTGCVPVLMKDNYVVPFSDVLNWKTFSVEISVKDVPNLKKILTAIPWQDYSEMQKRGRLVRKHFEVNLPPKRFDFFHMILHSIWLRRLNLGIHYRS
ncbi:hypothetical protein RJ640_000359 [Escallonia rubra]|uniref:Exostosin GT47 domain-containing protein n=1 Tax=Escallonia rubra TaxID=112253 RepID=A0AA88RT17_9ASTE|nr:hypothetical protein RJ640_000359 [Escallonia rubra]